MTEQRRPSAHANGRRFLPCQAILFEAVRDLHSLENRETMMFNDDGTVSVENDPLPEQRELMVPLMYHYNGL